MDVEVLQTKLSTVLSSAARIAQTRGQLPILANVLLKVSGDTLRVSATNLELAIISDVQGKIHQEGSITVPARLLADFVANLPNETVHLKQKENALHISCGGFSSTIQGTTAEDFPSLPEVSDSEEITISTTTIADALSQVVFAASSDESRPVLTGVTLISQGDEIVFTATDSYRLAEKKIPIKQETTFDQVIIPAKTFVELQRVLPAEGDLLVALSEGQVKFKAGSISVISRLIEGNFPAYQQLIPEEAEVEISVDKKDFIRITKVAALFAKEAAGSITIHADETKNELSVTAVASQVGENTSIAKAEVRGSGEITLNSRYLVDALNVIPEEKVSFSFSGKVSPTVLKPAKNQDYTHVIMPLRS